MGLTGAEMDVICCHLWISGRVQGVWFRQSTAQQAQAIGDLAGWVRNLPDGRVEVLVAGERALVMALVDWCQHGPPTARVDRVECEQEALPQALQAFHVRV